MATKSQQQYEKEIYDRGFSKVATWTDQPNAYYEPHSHEAVTTILVLKGQLTVLFPAEKDAQKTTLGPGEGIDVGAHQLHEVWIGSDGCTSVVGE